MNAVSRSRWWRAAAAFAISIAVAATGSAWSAAALGSTPDGSAAEVAEQVLEQQLDAAGISGGAVALVSEGRVDARGVGDVDGDRLATAETPFVIGSATKSLTALAVMQLVDSGEVDLDAPVRDYVPELELGRGRPADEITVREVLQQTSGLDDLAGGPLLASAADGSPLDAVAELKDTELGSAPGETWRYANINYVLAGLVVERASGERYADYVQHEIFDPLGMDHSSATSRPVSGDVVADGHRFWFGVPVATKPTRRSATLAAGYVISTAEDLGRYLSLYLADGVGPDGTRVVSGAGLEVLLGAGPAAQLGPWAEGQDSRYAMGWFVGGPWGDDAIFHPGNTPDSTTMLALFPERGMAVAVLVNAGNELPVPGNPFIADRISRNMVHAALGQPVADLPSMWRFYAAFDLISLLLIGAAAWGLLPGCADLRCSHGVAASRARLGRGGGQGSGCRPARRLPAAQLRLERPVDLVPRPRGGHRRRGSAAGRRSRPASGPTAAARARHPTRHLHRREPPPCIRLRSNTSPNATATRWSSTTSPSRSPRDGSPASWAPTVRGSRPR